MASVEVSNMARCSSETNALSDIDSMECRARNITIKIGTISKSQSSRHVEPDKTGD